MAKQFTAVYEVKDLSELSDLIAYLNEEGFFIIQTVTDKKHNEEQGDYFEVLVITAPIEEEEFNGTSFN